MAELANPVTIREPAFGGALRARLALRHRLDVRAWPTVRQFLLVLLVIYLAKQALNVIVFPPFTGHDEVAHYAYLRIVAKEHRLPTLIDLPKFQQAIAAHQKPPGDFVPDDLYRYCNYVLYWYCEPDNPNWSRNPPHAWTFQNSYYPSGDLYTANHPPLYYILMTPIYLLSDQATPATQQYLLRVAVIPFGILTVLMAYLLTRALFPGDAFLTVTVPTFVAFQPQISYEAAMVNNDILCIALYSCILYLLVVGIRDRFPIRICVLTGFTLGLALLAKGTAQTAVPIIAVAVILGVGWRNVRQWVPRGAIIGALAGLLAWPWYLFLYRTYGNFSGLDQVEQLQQWWNYYNKPKPSLIDELVNRDFIVLRWKETWGEFGWRLIALDSSLLWIVAIPCLIAGVGLIIYALSISARMRQPEVATVGRDEVATPRRWQVTSLGMLVLAVAVAYFAVLQFGTRFSLTQARYYFPAIDAFALLLLLGLRTLIPRAWHRYGQAAVFGSMVLLNVVIYTQYVVPFWHSQV